MSFSKEDILKKVHDENIEVIRLWFTDILGTLKGFAITKREMETAFTQGFGFDGSSIEGFARIHESDLMAHPDPTSFTLLPQDTGYKAARMICDLKTPEGEVFAGDARGVLRRNLDKAESMGYTFYVGPELEFFLFENDRTPKALDHNGYFDASIHDKGTTTRQKIIFALEEMGIPVEYSHHEVAPSQHEIDLRYSKALTMADNCQTYKFIVKEIAAQEGFYATFMPKPIFGENGSGMHVHQSLFKNGRNVFFDPQSPYNLSQTARYYLGGILKYAKEMTSILNQTVNSYKRLVAGYEAPVYISWGQMNRSALLRVPRIRLGYEKSTRLELRSPDPVANPYLAFSVMLAAGLKGIEEKIEPPMPIEEDIFTLSSADRKRLEIDTIPGNLHDAILLTEKSELVREALGDHVFSKFIENKKLEWEDWRMQVTDYEIKKYLPIL